MLNDRKNSVFTEGWQHEHLTMFDLSYRWTKSPQLEAIEKNVPSSLYLFFKKFKCISQKSRSSVIK